jgi:hypothetical protein
MSRLERYRERRTVGQELNSEILSVYADREAILESARLLGIERRGNELLYETEGETSIHYDFLLHEYQQDGRTPVERYFEQERWSTEEERTVLEAYVQASTSLFEVTAVDDQKKRLVLSDRLNGDEETTVTDISLSRSAEPGILLFARLVPYDEFNIGSGIWFPFEASQHERLLDEYEQWEGPTDYQTPAMRRFVAFYDLYRDRGIHMQYV